MYYVLLYDVVPDYLERRAPYRQEHLGLVTEAHKRGEIVMAGALADPADGAILVFKCDNTTPVEDFVKSDPYVKTGIITHWRIRPWTVVVGG